MLSRVGLGVTEAVIPRWRFHTGYMLSHLQGACDSQDCSSVTLSSSSRFRFMLNLLLSVQVSGVLSHR